VLRVFLSRVPEWIMFVENYLQPSLSYLWIGLAALPSEVALIVSQAESVDGDPFSSSSVVLQQE
jgi:hypothetical protein